VLRIRLGRRGVGVPVGALLAVLDTEATAAMSAVLADSAARMARRIPTGAAAGATTSAVEALARDVAGILTRHRLSSLVMRAPLVVCAVTLAAIWVVKQLSDLPSPVAPETKIQRLPIRAAIQATRMKMKTPDGLDLETQLWLAKSMQEEVVLTSQREVVSEALKTAARELEQARIAALEMAKAPQYDVSRKTTADHPHERIEQLNARIERLTTEAAELHIRWQRNRQEREYVERVLRGQD
jgi:hypothetical protein